MSVDGEPSQAYQEAERRGQLRPRRQDRSSVNEAILADDSERRSGVFSILASFTSARPTIAVMHWVLLAPDPPDPLCSASLNCLW